MEPWHLFGHFVIGLGISFFVFKKTKNIGYIFLCLLASFLIDVDHLFDFWMAYGFSLDLGKFFEINFFKINGKVFVPFHSWELVGLILLLSKFAKKYKWVLLTVSLAMFGHILWDAISYKIVAIDYSLIYRSVHDFKIRCHR